MPPFFQALALFAPRLWLPRNTEFLCRSLGDYTFSVKPREGKVSWRSGWFAANEGGIRLGIETTAETA
jgi:hypothetical protein